MGRLGRIFMMLALSVTFMGVDRGCNIFQFFGDTSNDVAKREDFKVAIAQQDWGHACAILKEFQDAGKEVPTPQDSSAAKGAMTRSLHDALIIALYSDNDFYNALTTNNTQALVCAMAKVTKDACTDANCLAVTNNCRNLINHSNLSALSATTSGLSCAEAYVPCSRLSKYYNTTGDTEAPSALEKCKEAQYAVRANATCNIALQCSPVTNGSGAPCGAADTCNTSTCNATSHITASNYNVDGTFLFFKNYAAACN